MDKRKVLAASILCVVALAQRASVAQENSSDATKENYQMYKMDSAEAADWEAKWEHNIVGEARNRYCDKEMGEEIGWVMSPLLSGFYHGYMATGDAKWVNLLVDCADAWVRRAVREPDGYLGWPKIGAAGTPVDGLDDLYADSLLGEAMALRPVVLMSKQILISPRLKRAFWRQGRKLHQTIGEDF